MKNYKNLNFYKRSSLPSLNKHRLKTGNVIYWRKRGHYKFEFKLPNGDTWYVCDANFKAGVKGVYKELTV